MCHFITAALPKSASDEALDALARKSGRQFQPLASPAVAAQLPAGSKYFLTTLAHCDCGTFMGSARRRATRSPDLATEQARLLKKGWSQAKVARALAQRSRSDATKRQTNAQSDQDEAQSLVGFVSSVLQSGLTSELGLLLHCYSGPLDEAFRIVRQEEVPTGIDLAAALPAMDEDVLYRFRKGC